MLFFVCEVEKFFHAPKAKNHKSTKFLKAMSRYAHAQRTLPVRPRWDRATVPGACGDGYAAEGYTGQLSVGWLVVIQFN